VLKFARSILFVLLVFGAKTTLKSQDDYVLKPPRDYLKDPAKNAGFIELGGNAGLYSLNFDRIYLYKEKLRLSARLGFAPEPQGFYIEQVYVAENNLILFSNPHHLEIGLGATMQRRYNERPNEPDNYFWENIWFGILRCGYRYQKQDDGFFFKAGLTPAIMSKDALGSHPEYFRFWAGVSIGMSY